MNTIKLIFARYGVNLDVLSSDVGPTTTTHTLKLADGTRIKRVNSALEDVAKDLKVRSVRLLLDSDVKLEVPNSARKTVSFRDAATSAAFRDSNKFDVLLGVDMSNKVVVSDLTKMPHLLVAGATGSGKSVGVHMMLCSLLAKCSPSDLQLVLIDPKMTELSMYNEVPHLMSRVITDMLCAKAALADAVCEMERRYKLMMKNNVRSIDGLNFPRILIVIDEFAELIMQDKDVEPLLVRIAQKARAAGIHLILATQRPVARVVTGLIKSNIPSRLCYRVISKTDSRIMLDQGGAEMLCGGGDGLFMNSAGSLSRLQAALTTDEDIALVVKATQAYKRLNNIRQYVPLIKRFDFLGAGVGSLCLIVTVVVSTLLFVSKLALFALGGISHSSKQKR